MTIITLPTDLESQLVDEARRLGTTPELLAVDGLRKLFAPATTSNGNGANEVGTLFDFLAGHIGTIDGEPEPYSEDCGRRFAEGLSEKQQRGRL